MKNLRYGKFRARVVDLNDPERRGRVKVSCPKVMGQGQSAWCEICVPCAYEGGGDFFLPKLGDTVWVEFEEGDPTKPIWVGSWWSSNNTPNKNYSNSDKLRIIEFDGCLIEMQKDQLRLKVNDCCVILNAEGVKIISPGTLEVTANGETVVQSRSNLSISTGGSASVSSSSNMTLKGATIHLN